MNEKSAETLSIARQFIDALTRLDAEAQIALLHDDAVLECPFPVRPGEGLPGTRRQSGPALREGLRQSAVNMRRSLSLIESDRCDCFAVDALQSRKIPTANIAAAEPTSYSEKRQRGYQILAQFP